MRVSYHRSSRHHGNHGHYRHNWTRAPATMLANVDARVQLINGLHRTARREVQHVRRPCRPHLMQQLVLDVGRSNRHNRYLLHTGKLIRSVVVSVGPGLAVAKVPTSPELRLARANADCR